MQYIKRPPFLTASEAFCKITFCAEAKLRRSFSVVRHLISGLRRNVPSPEQGASTRTQSNFSFNESGRPTNRSSCCFWIMVIPSRVASFFSSAIFSGLRSTATIRPLFLRIAAKCVALPPEPAQASYTKSALFGLIR